MQDLRQLAEEYKADLDEINDMAEEIYKKNFSNYFQVPKNLAAKLRSGSDISDNDLEDVLITVPLKLFEASESLNKFRLSLEVLKTRIRDKRVELTESIEQSYQAQDTKYTQSQVSKAVDYEMSGDNLLISLYESIIKRVENEISFTKELIMSSKKLFTARSENVMPVGEVDIDKTQQNKTKEVSNLPEYAA